MFVAQARRQRSKVRGRRKGNGLCVTYTNDLQTKRILANGVLLLGEAEDEHVDVTSCGTLKEKTAGEAGRRVASNLALFLGLWQFFDLVRCHVDLKSVADAVEPPIGDNNHVAAETEKATNSDANRGDLAGGFIRHGVNESKVGPIR